MRQELLGEKLKAVIDQLPPQGVSLAEIRDLFGQEGLLLLTIFLTVPFMVPVSIPGVSTVFGAAILLIGISRAFGRGFWLPKRVERKVLPAEQLHAGLRQGLKWLEYLERFTRPRRMGAMTSDGLRGQINNVSFIVGAILLMAPFGFVPLSNTLPGLGLLLLGIGLLQKDGLFILLGHCVNILTILYFGFLITGGIVIVERLWRYFFAAH